MHNDLCVFGPTLHMKPEGNTNNYLDMDEWALVQKPGTGVNNHVNWNPVVKITFNYLMRRRACCLPLVQVCLLCVNSPELRKNST